MIARRHFLQASAAAAALYGAGSLAGRAKAQALTQDDLTAFDTTGNVTLIHVTDIHAQLMPIYFREPSINLGVGDAAGRPPHLTGDAFLERFKLQAGGPAAYALTYKDFEALAKEYGKMGGMDRVSTVVKQIRADRPDALLLDGGDTWQGSLTSNRTQGQDMINVMNFLKPDAMTAHWEFTYGTERVREAVESLPFPFLGANIFDVEWDEPAFESTMMVERGGVKIAVIGQAFPYMPIANPGWMFPEFSFGIRETRMAEVVQTARDDGAHLVVVLSHNGFDVDYKLAENVPGIDVILTGHTHDAMPEPLLVGKTLLIGSGSNGKFVSRLDLDVDSSGMKGWKYKLIPIFSDAIAPDPEMTALIDEQRKPFADELSEVLATTDSVLYRRGNFNGTFDDVICQALLEEREADIALSPGFRWGPSLLPGQDITREDLHNATAMTYPSAYRNMMTGETLKVILEDVADNIFNTDPYYQQGGDMVRVGGMGYKIDVSKPIGDRISDMTLLKTGEPLDASKEYAVAGWASVNPEVEGPAIWDVVESYLKRVGTVTAPENESVVITGI